MGQLQNPKEIEYSCMSENIASKKFFRQSINLTHTHNSVTLVM